GGNLVNANSVGPIRDAFGTDPNTLVRASNAVQYFIPRLVPGLEATVMIAVDERAGTAANGHRWVGGRVNYEFGPIGLGAATSQVKNSRTAGDHLSDSSMGIVYSASGVRLTAALRKFSFRSSEQRNLILGAKYITGPHEFKATYGSMNISGTVGGVRVDANDASQIAIGYVHHMSKRTALYATAVRLKNEGLAAQVIGGGPGVLRGGSTTGTELGIRHAF
ncbi:MAG: porin, gram-negative type, partial [Burkholderiales bacterium]|nr:porin, gram-negative type [Burkholderiales bacterium]